MTHGITGIDHAVVAVADVEAERARFLRLGFVTSPRRRFVDWGTANYGVMFGDDFIELLGIVDATAFLTPGLVDFLAGGEGAMAVTMHSSDVTAAHRDLEAGGFAPTPLGEVTINCEAAEGVLLQQFRWLRVGEAATPDMYLMLVQPLTPENMRRPAWLDHPNTAQGIRSMTMVSADPGALIAPYERLFGAPARDTEGGFEISTGRGDFRFVTADGLRDCYGDLARGVAHPAPAIAALTLTARDLGRVAACLEVESIGHELVEGAVRVGPADACGMILEFVPAD
jgi:hypothetical protein